ncbi:MAG: LPS export ABC transporter periplasmic protein LptC, partial [Parvularculaceae bacterium]|nr:LPS export ABC transporter periplasmic protein LptC [Parvularculaceae bacterium]
MSEADDQQQDANQGGSLTATARVAARRGVLESLQPRTRLTTTQAAARSRFVSQMRVVLPIIVVVLVGVFFASARKDAGNDPRLSDFKNAEEVKSTFELGGAKSAGVTKDGRPYTIEFDSATQDTDDSSVADLVKPKATTMRKEGENSVVTADKGQYDQQDNHLKLEENVRLTHVVAGEPYVIKAPTAEADVRDGVVTITTG